MKSPILIATILASLLLPGVGSGAFAAPRESAADLNLLSVEHMAAFTDARIAALKVGLKLTATQEKNWPTLETTLRDVGKDRAARILEWQTNAKEHHGRNDVIEGLRLRAKWLSTRSLEFDKIADAAKPLYDSLDDSQKTRFGVLLHEVFKHPDHHWHWGMHADDHMNDTGDVDNN
jgi:hypothetical protein